MSDLQKWENQGAHLAFGVWRLKFEVWPRAAASPAAGQAPNARHQTPNAKVGLLRLASLALVLAPTAARACSVCMGDNNSNFASAANAAIFLMIGAIGSVLAALTGFGFYLYKRASAPIPPHVQLVAEMSGDEDEDSPHA